MAKRIQLVLNRAVTKLGKSGDLVEVAPGYARNYLLPQGMAVPATPGILKQVEHRRQLEQQRLLEQKQAAETLKGVLEAVESLVVPKQVGEGDAIFGSVTDREVAAAILEVTGQEVDRRQIEVPEIRKAGQYQVEIKLHPEVIVRLPLQVVPQ